MARSAKQKAATRKLVALNKKRKTKKSTSTKKGQVRKTARKAFKGLRKRKSMPRKGLKGLTSSSTLKKVALGVGGATLATAMISFIAPNSSIAKFAAPAGAYALGGIEGIIGQFALGMLRPSSQGNSNVIPEVFFLGVYIVSLYHPSL